MPRYVLGGPGQTPPSEKVNIACIGTGGQGISDMKRFLANPDARVIAVCDVLLEDIIPTCVIVSRFGSMILSCDVRHQLMYGVCGDSQCDEKNAAHIAHRSAAHRSDRRDRCKSLLPRRAEIHTCGRRR